jgi:hypothetical protein
MSDLLDPIPPPATKLWPKPVARGAFVCGDRAMTLLRPDRLARLGTRLALACVGVGAGAALGCADQISSSPADSGPSATTAAPSDAGASTSQAASASAATPEPPPPSTSFDGPPAATVPLEPKPFEWPRQRLSLRAPKGWLKAVVQGYPVVRAADGKAFVALFGDVGALPPQSHLDMRVKWLDGFAVDWGRSGNGKVGPGHLAAELREGPGKVVESVDGKNVGREARFWAVFFEPPGRTEGLLVIAAAQGSGPEHASEIVAIVQSIAAK